tara:strand:+ start:25587 stop:25820 length:234 start_codon:yes stop_codon:yes gene_type:complete
VSKFSERKIPHQAIVTITGVLYEQLQDGSVSPVPKYIEEAILTNLGTTEKECVEEMIHRIKDIKQIWKTNKENTQKK